MRKKIFIAIFLFIGLATLTFFGITLLQTVGVYGHYECTVYTEQTTGEPLNILNNYDYYRLELKLNRSFVLTSLIEGEDTEVIASGTFTKSGNTITLIYEEGQNPVEALIFPKEIFTFDDDVLSRNQTGTFTDTSFQTTIVQQFVKVD
ncbi:MAG: hypothetical protein AB7V00_01705 [Bacilli bacterium]